MSHFKKTQPLRASFLIAIREVLEYAKSSNELVEALSHIRKTIVPNHIDGIRSVGRDEVFSICRRHRTRHLHVWSNDACNAYGKLCAAVHAGIGPSPIQESLKQVLCFLFLHKQFNLILFLFICV